MVNFLNEVDWGSGFDQSASFRALSERVGTFPGFSAIICHCEHSPPLPTRKEDLFASGIGMWDCFDCRLFWSFIVQTNVALAHSAGVFREVLQSGNGRKRGTTSKNMDNPKSFSAICKRILFSDYSKLCALLGVPLCRFGSFPLSFSFSSSKNSSPNAAITLSPMHRSQLLRVRHVSVQQALRGVVPRCKAERDPQPRPLRRAAQRRHRSLGKKELCTRAVRVVTGVFITGNGKWIGCVIIFLIFFSYIKSCGFESS